MIQESLQQTILETITNIVKTVSSIFTASYISASSLFILGILPTVDNTPLIWYIFMLRYICRNTWVEGISFVLCFQYIASEKKYFLELCDS